jgi:hypothetical protein
MSFWFTDQYDWRLLLFAAALASLVGLSATRLIDRHSRSTDKPKLSPSRSEGQRQSQRTAATKGRISWLTSTKCMRGTAFFDADPNQFLTD